jgi:hypothetical protein
MESIFDDLQGNNEEGVNLEFKNDAEGAEEKLSQWMDFWSPGNHDDRNPCHFVLKL